MVAPHPAKEFSPRLLKGRTSSNPHAWLLYPSQAWLNARVTHSCLCLLTVSRGAVCQREWSSKPCHWILRLLATVELAEDRSQTLRGRRPWSVSGLLPFWMPVEFLTPYIFSNGVGPVIPGERDLTDSGDGHCGFGGAIIPSQAMGSSWDLVRGNLSFERRWRALAPVGVVESQGVSELGTPSDPTLLSPLNGRSGACAMFRTARALESTSIRFEPTKQSSETRKD